MESETQKGAPLLFYKHSENGCRLQSASSLSSSRGTTLELAEVAAFQLPLKLANGWSAVQLPESWLIGGGMISVTGWEIRSLWSDQSPEWYWCRRKWPKCCQCWTCSASGGQVRTTAQLNISPQLKGCISICICGWVGARSCRTKTSHQGLSSKQLIAKIYLHDSHMMVQLMLLAAKCLKFLPSCLKMRAFKSFTMQAVRLTWSMQSISNGCLSIVASGSSEIQSGTKGCDDCEGEHHIVSQMEGHRRGNIVSCCHISNPLPKLHLQGFVLGLLSIAWFRVSSFRYLLMLCHIDC